MRTGVVALALVLLVLAPVRAAHAQFSFDARRYGMGGVSLSRDGNARRYNPAYRAVKNKNHVAGAPKFSIPVPFGLIQFFKDHPINQQLVIELLRGMEVQADLAQNGLQAVILRVGDYLILKYLVIGALQ